MIDSNFQMLRMGRQNDRPNRPVAANGNSLWQAQKASHRINTPEFAGQLKLISL